MGKRLCLIILLANKNGISQKLSKLRPSYLLRSDFGISTKCVQSLKEEAQTEKFLEMLKYLIVFQNSQKQLSVEESYKLEIFMGDAQ